MFPPRDGAKQKLGSVKTQNVYPTKKRLTCVFPAVGGGRANWQWEHMQRSTCMMAGPERTSMVPTEYETVEWETPKERDSLDTRSTNSHYGSTHAKPVIPLINGH